MNIELLYDRECIICLDNKEKEWITLECRHEYHKACIHHWMRVRMICPICIRAISPQCDEIVEHVPDVNGDLEAEHGATHEYCERGVSRLLCTLLLLACLCILVGSIISYVYR